MIGCMCIPLGARKSLSAAWRQTLGLCYRVLTRLTTPQTQCFSHHLCVTQGGLVSLLPKQNLQGITRQHHSASVTSRERDWAAHEHLQPVSNMLSSLKPNPS